MERVKKLEINSEKFNDKESFYYGKRKSFTGYASFDKPWLKYYPEGVENTVVPDMSMYQMLVEYNKGNLNSVAMRYFGFPIKYRDYFDKIEKYSKSLLSIGVKKGDIVLLALPNVPECRELIYALNKIGAIAYPVSPMLSGTELSKIINENNIKTVFMFDMFFEKFGKVLSASDCVKNIIVNDGAESIPIFFRKLSELKKKLFNFESKNNVPKDCRNMSFSEFSMKSKKYSGKEINIYDKNSVAVIIGTSGTTGTSKGVCLTNENLNAMALQHFVGDMHFEKGDRILDILIQSIGYGIAVAHYSGICSLESVMIPELVIHILPFIKKYEISHFTGGPIHYINLLKDVDNDKTKVPKIKNYVSGGATLPKDVESQLNGIESDLVEINNENEVIIRQGLGCTENGGAATYAKRGAYKFGGVGIPLALENMAIFKPGTDEELPIGELGEICISGPTIMLRYLNNETETERVLKVHSDGTKWLHTCDLGTIDNDGQVYITDRIKDIFMRKGFNVHPSKVNEFLEKLDIVESSKVIGVSHPDEQTVPVAFIKLKCDMSIEEAKKIILEKCYDGLEEPSIPYEIVFVDQMPRNIGGKIDANYLLELSQIDYYSDKTSNKIITIKK